MSRDKKDYDQKSQKWADAIGNITIKLSLNNVLGDDDFQESNATDHKLTSENSDEQQKEM